MTDQPNPYETSETETKGVLVGEAKTPLGQRKLWLYPLLGCVLPMVLLLMAIIAFIILMIYEAKYLGV